MAKNALLKHRRKDIREAFAQTVTGRFLGPAEADGTYVSGKAHNMHHRDNERRISGRGGADRAIVVSVLDRATNTVVAGPVADTSARTLTGIVDSVTADGAAVFIDEHRSCKPLAPLGYAHGALAHSACESVRGDVCEQGTEKHMDAVAADMVGKRLRCDDLIAA